MTRLFRKVFIIALFLLLILTTAGCIRETPQEVLNKMLKKTARADAITLDLKLGIHGLFPELEQIDKDDAEFLPGAIFVNLQGPMNFDNFECQLSGNAKYRAGENSTDFDGGLIYKDKSMYFSLNKLESTPAPAKANWYEINSPFGSKEANIDAKSAKEEGKRNRQLKKAFQKRIFLNVIEDSGIDVLNNIQTHRYKVKLDAKKAIEFFKEATEIMEDREISGQELAELSENINDYSMADTQIWIGVNDYLPYRLEVSYQKQPDSRRYSVAAAFANFGQPAEIKKPENIQTFDLAKVLSSELFGEPQAEGSGAVDWKEQLKQIPGVDDKKIEEELKKIEAGE